MLLGKGHQDRRRRRLSEDLGTSRGGEERGRTMSSTLRAGKSLIQRIGFQPCAGSEVGGAGERAA